MTVEHFGEQGVEPSPFRGVEAGEEFVLDGVGVLLELVEMPPAGGGEGDDVAAPVRGAGPTIDLVVTFEAVEDAVDVVAVKAEAAGPRHRGRRTTADLRPGARTGQDPSRRPRRPGPGIAGQVGAVAVAASSATTVGGREIRLRGQAEVAEALALFPASRTAGAGEGTGDEQAPAVTR